MIKRFSNWLIELQRLLVIEIVVSDASVATGEDLLQYINEFISTLNNGDVFIDQK